ncbi:MmgE/PrpD family protein [Cupriavidus sp. UME77]|uniref:MmgE/PrpD family protein n=1 Tax=Cupriavidus sp. UME77 TaxID=1862321 RepID=UPI00160086F1|nr:MmgE/PrpD family protein [Cupriavidus sp. UME77]MBB1634913.1 2-methylcitrate dehydratase [Cupriavidus sp. UME77]
MATIVEKLGSFASETRFEDLPDHVVEESKRLLLDAVGCALGGHSHSKGTIGIEFARRIGAGTAGAQATVLGTNERLSAVGAAFANAELTNALDFDAILPPGHVSPYVIPGALAESEARGGSGKDLLSAIAIGHEISYRIAKALDYLRDVKDGKISPPPVNGFSSTVFGAAAAIGKVKGYSPEMTASAIGITGSMSPVNAQWSWSVHSPTASVKYAVAGALVQAAMTGAWLAELGHTGDVQLLDDPDCGWRRMIGSSRWAPEHITAELGTTWRFPAEQAYKPYPHCRILHAPLDALAEILEGNDIRPSEIDGIKAWVEGFVMQPLWLNREITHVTQAQFSIAHGLSVGAHRIPPGKAWQSPEVVFDPSVLDLMDKIECAVHPDYETLLTSNAASRPTRIEVRARGKSFVAERRYPKGSPSPDPATTMSNEELAAKFARNAEGVISERNVDQFINGLWKLESMVDVRELFRLVAKP